MKKRKLKPHQKTLRFTVGQINKLDLWSEHLDMSPADFIGVLLLALPNPGSRQIDINVLAAVIQTAMEGVFNDEEAMKEND
jgi:hypothetical protein